MPCRQNEGALNSGGSVQLLQKSEVGFEAAYIFDGVKCDEGELIFVPFPLKSYQLRDDRVTRYPHIYRILQVSHRSGNT